jgi:hypothetical protein
MRFYFTSKFNCHSTASKFGTSVNAIEVFVSYWQKKLREMIGQETVDLILNDDIDTAMVQFRVGTGQNGYSTDLFLAGINQLLPSPKRNQFFLIEECFRELTYFVHFSHFNINNVLHSLDQEKVAHLLFLMNSEDKRFATEREAIWRLLKGDYLEKDGKVRSYKAQTQMAIEVINSENVYL